MRESCTYCKTHVILISSQISQIVSQISQVCSSSKQQLKINNTVLITWKKKRSTRKEWVI